MDTKHNALELAGLLEQDNSNWTSRACAALLRRQQARIEVLERALYEAAGCLTGHRAGFAWQEDYDGPVLQQARALLSKKD